jgi:hypothetical protein
MPPQTYQWNLRGVVEDPADQADATAAPAHPGTPPEPPGATPPGPPPLHQPSPAPAGQWRAPGSPVGPVAVRSVSGVAAACVVALLLPAGLAVAIEGLAWHHQGKVNWVLVTLVAAIVAIGSLLIGLLASELGRRRTLPRALSAAALSSVATVLLALLIDAHPVKFGFHLNAWAWVALAGPLLAFVASVGRAVRR